jgi:hypothetical protein
MRNYRIAFLAALLLFTASQDRAQCPSSNVSGAQCQAAISKLTSMLTADGYTYYSTNSPTVFTVHLQRDHMQKIKLIMALGDDAADPSASLVVFVTVVQRYRLPTDTEFRRKLLAMNHTFDSVKIGFDNDGDLSVRIDTSFRVIDASLLRAVIDQVAAASDEVYGQIETQLLPATGPDPNNSF